MGQPTEREAHSLGRRAFLRSGAIGGAAAFLTVRSSDARPAVEPTSEAPPVPRFELNEATIADLQDRMISVTRNTHIPSVAASF